MTHLPTFITARINHGLRCGLLTAESNAIQVFNVIGHRAYVRAALRFIRQS